jgi:hypothetical protein
MSIIFTMSAAPVFATTGDPQPDEAAAQSEAEADAESNHCVMVEVWYRLLSGSQWYLVGPNQCVAGTPWTRFITYKPSAEVPGVLEVGVGVGIPFP